MERQREQQEIARTAIEAEEKRQREYNELKRREGEAIAKANIEKQRAEDENKLREKKEKEFENIKDDLNSRIKKLTEDLKNTTEDLKNTTEDLKNKTEDLKNKTEDLKNKTEDLKNKTEDLKKKGKGCFWLETQVKLESGRIIRMSELQIGDRVLSNIRNGIAEFSDVYLIAHIGQLRLTTTHYVFDENLSIIFAKNLRPGEKKILVSDDNNRLVPVFVDDITNEWHDKYISFYTRAGSVIADGVLCSCYDHCPPSQTLMDLVFSPVRWWTHIMPSTHREEHLHPYVQFLETTYLSFINAVKKSKRLVEI
ncbi:unnamed protein product [Rhizophagus irregularis]|uniref:Hedgehog protein Hint domain-containing protein n=1 Tax=Rhizophagus irregularis TaxID=588596 RepID=A0A916EIG0_9GLOM|nr:unnamed protein product [Rhizophagus irregularis]